MSELIVLLNQWSSPFEDEQPYETESLLHLEIVAPCKSAADERKTTTEIGSMTQNVPHKPQPANLPDIGEVHETTTTTTATVTAAPGTPTTSGSAFLRLPAEIRLQIYHCVLLLCDADDGGTCKPSTWGAPAAAVWTPDMLFPPWLPYYVNYGKDQQRGGRRTVVRFQVVDDDDEEKGEEEENARTPHGQGGGPLRLLSPYAPSGRRPLPTALLCACRQVYWEARGLPFAAGELAFARGPAAAAAASTAAAAAAAWFPSPSALARAHAFLAPERCREPSWPPPSRMRPWQRDGVRRVRLEVDAGAADIGWWWSADGSKGQEEDDEKENHTHAKSDEKDKDKRLDRTKWLELCGALAAGLQGLRLTLSVTEAAKSEEPAEGSTAAKQAADNAEDADTTDNKRRATKATSTADCTRASVDDCVFVQGLRQLAALRQLEVELTWVGRGGHRSLAANMSRDERRAMRAWCAAVQTAVNRTRMQGDGSSSRSSSSSSVRVVWVERIRQT